MSTDSAPRVAGVAGIGQELALALRCPGCARDGSTVNHIGEHGHLQKGHTANASGMKKGTKHATTIEAANELKAVAVEAAEYLTAQLRDTLNHPQMRMWAATQILSRTMPDKLKDEGAVDAGFVQFMTQQELATVDAIYDRAIERRREAEEAGVIDVAPQRVDEVVLKREEPEPPPPEPEPDPDELVIML
jgi:hypothetical protein